MFMLNMGGLYMPSSPKKNIGVLELMKVNRIRMIEDDNGVPESLHNTATRFEINYDYKEPEKTSEDETTEDNA